ncbi:hypothetical protein [Mycobacterium sp. M23085]
MPAWLENDVAASVLAVWALIGPLHRVVAPRLMRRSAHRSRLPAVWS